MTLSLQSRSARDPALSSNIESESEDDTEPEELVKKYISLQSRIFKICPDGCSRVESRESSKHKINRSGETTKLSPELARLYRKIEKIQSDVLFDQSEALAQWVQIRSQLAKDSAERNKYQLDQDCHAEKSAVIRSSSRNIDNDKAHDEDELTFMFGDMFTSSLETSTAPRANSTSSLGNNNDGKTVTIRDFGEWTGVNPRRVFENSCKSR